MDAVARRVGTDHLHPGLLALLDHLLGLFERDRHRLLDHHVLAVARGRHGMLGVEPIR